jgi:hypothetical protein
MLALIPILLRFLDVCFSFKILQQEEKEAIGEKKPNPEKFLFCCEHSERNLLDPFFTTPPSFPILERDWI